MQGDFEAKLTEPPRRDLWTLPKIKELRIERVRYRVPHRRTVLGRSLEIGEAVEILVHTDGEIPIRALSPALFIGSQQVAENEQLEPTLYRFVVFDEKALRRGASIALGWVGQASPKTKGRAFRYEAPREVVER